MTKDKLKLLGYRFDAEAAAEDEGKREIERKKGAKRGDGERKRMKKKCVMRGRKREREKRDREEEGRERMSVAACASLLCSALDFFSFPLSPLVLFCLKGPSSHCLYHKDVDDFLSLLWGFRQVFLGLLPSFPSLTLLSFFPSLRAMLRVTLGCSGAVSSVLLD